MELITHDEARTLISDFRAERETLKLALTDGAYEPSPELLCSVIHALFFSSLLVEEGRPVLTRVQFRNDESSYVKSRFSDRKELNTQLLRKLSPIMAAPGISVSVADDGKMGGICVGVPNNAMSAFSERPGRIVIADELNVVAVLEDGKWHTVPGRNMFQLWLAGSLLVGFGTSRMLQALISSTRRHRRGALMVWFAEEPVSFDRMIAPAFGIQSASLIDAEAEQDADYALRRGDLAAYDAAVKRAKIAGRDVAGRVNFLAYGSGIDGATLLGPNLEPLGFGAKLDAPKLREDFRQYDWETMALTRTSLSDVRGTRHQSAIRFVQSTKGTLAVIFSQDGPVSVVVPAPNNIAEGDHDVVVIPHIDRFLEAEWTYRHPE